MSDKRIYDDYLRDMLDAMTKARSFVGKMSYQEFAADQKTVYAVIRALEIIGEASKNVPGNIRRKYPALPWKAMAGMRDILAHRYFGVDMAAVWKALQEDIPAAMREVRRMIKSRKT